MSSSSTPCGRSSEPADVEGKSGRADEVSPTNSNNRFRESKIEIYKIREKTKMKKIINKVTFNLKKQVQYFEENRYYITIV